MDRKKKRKKEIRLSRSKSAVLRMEHYRTLSKETKKKKKFYTKVYLCISKMPKTFNVISIILYRDLGCSV